LVEQRSIEIKKEWFNFPTKSVIGTHYFVGRYTAPRATALLKR